MILRLRRRVFGVAPPLVTRAEATEIARKDCEAHDWPWREPVQVRERLDEYVFWTNARMRGGNAAIVVGIHDGEVRQATITSR